MKKITIIVLFLMGCSHVPAQTCSTQSDSQTNPDSTKKAASEKASVDIEQILLNINNAAKKLHSCQAKISYLSIQDPELLDTRVLRTGTLFYRKSKDRSNLRIRFDDLKQDDFEPEKRREEYLFDGVWLTHIDFKLEQINLYQQAPEDEPVGVFELINNNFPLIGFSGTDPLKAEFDISLDKAPADSNEPSTCLILDVKEHSKFKDSYNKVLFWIDNDLYLPKKVIAYTPQGDESHIEFSYVYINKKLENGVFTVETPEHFSKNIEPLETKP
jgi:hypothetical protein